VRLIFKNLNILRSTLNAISTSFDVKGIVESAGTHLPSLFNFASFGLLRKEDFVLYLYQEESCPPLFTQEVLKKMVQVLSTIDEEAIDVERVTLQMEKRRLRGKPMLIDPGATLKSQLTLPLAMDGEIMGCISLNSDQPNTFDVQDLQFFSVIGYQMAATLKHFQRLSSIKNMASYDTLTGLYNRRYFEERLGMEAEKFFRSGSSLSLIMVDVDHFKKVNDTFGHGAGDKALCRIASLLKGSVRKKDVVARYGGEEFILILPEAGLKESSMIAERIRRLVESTPLDVERRQIRLTVSMGICSFPTHQAKSKEELVEQADVALYNAKRGGRNRVCVFSG
jgi:diguanylate cyclase (GGDEF)-like protein